MSSRVHHLVRSEVHRLLSTKALAVSQIVDDRRVVVWLVVG